ncbi:MAG: tetratricopeptide repeat protein [Candidatus Omnitrophica bacterium]|nr:tetratricopeptide repeat protein [Candidatus Omnitrophota bacterium]
MKETKIILLNPTANPAKKFGECIAKLEKFIRQYPKNILTVDAQFNIAKLYFAKKEYENGRKLLNEMLKNYSQSPIICSEILVQLGQSYQLEGKIDSAILEYEKIINEYPLTPNGLRMPILIAQVYKSEHIPEKMNYAYQRAVKHYEGLIQKYPNSPIALECYKLIASCYTELRQWGKAIQTLEEIIQKFQSKASMDRILFDIALIYQQKLNDNQKARETLQRLINDFPQSRLTATAKSLIKKL